MPPITLTRAQFLQQRPQGSYPAYRSYIGERRAAPAVAAPVDPLAGLTATYRSYLQTPAQLRASTRSSVNDQLKSALAASSASIAEQQRQYAQQAERAQGFALALAQATQPDPAALASQYRESAGRLRAYGTGLTGAVEQAQQAAAEKSRQAVANLTGGLGTVGGYDPAALRTAAQMTGVTLPGTTLEEQATAAFQRAGAARAASAGQVGQIAQGYLQKQADLATTLRSKQAELEAQRPELYRKGLAEATQQQRSNMATVLQALALQNTQRTAGATITGYDPYTGKPTATTVKTRADIAAAKAKAAAEAARPNSALSSTYGYIVNGSGQPILDAQGRRQPVKGWHRTARDEIVPDKKPAGRGGAGGFQTRVVNGNTLLFDKPTGNFYLPGDTKTPINPNNLMPKDPGRTTGEIQQMRARANAGVYAMLYGPKGSKKMLPRLIYTQGRAEGIDGWALLQALRAEATNHPEDSAWRDVLRRGWVAGK